MEQLQREVQSLTDKLSSMTVSGSKKKNRRRRKAKSVQNASQPGLVGVAGGSTSRKRSKKQGTKSVNGQLTLTRREYLRDVKVSKPTTDGTLADWSDYIDMIPSNLSLLSKFTMFDRVKWNKFHLFYKPGVGSTFNGFVSYGVLWAFNETSATRSQISALTPNRSHALWFDGETTPLVCPVSKLQTRPWYTPTDANDAVERAPGRILITTSCPDAKATAVVGELWVDYSVTLTGTSF